jgi:hypothetical protein
VTNPALRALLRQNRGLEALNVYCCTFISPEAFYLHLDAAPTPAAVAAAAAQQQQEEEEEGALGGPVPVVPVAAAAAAAAAGPAVGVAGEECMPLALREANLSYMRGYVILLHVCVCV